MAQPADTQSALQITTDADNVRTIVMDAPGKPVNTVSSAFLAELSQAVTAIEQDKPAAVIFTSAKKRSFCVGADLTEIKSMTRERVGDYIATGQATFDRIAHLPMPTVAAINGDSLGGGFELALACRYRVAADDAAISIGLPEVKLGLLPAWGGTTRLPRTIGLRAALPILLAGKTMPPGKALKAGLVDEMVRSEALLDAARRIVLARGKPHCPPVADHALTSIAFARNRYLNATERQTLAMSYGNYPAPIRLLQAVRAGYDHSFAAGLEAERNGILDLAEGAVGKNLLRLFFLRQGAKKQAASRIPAKPRDIRQAAVIGGGTMGAGIAHALIRAGIPVRLVEISPSAVSAALGRVQAMIDADVSAGRLDQLSARHAMNHLTPTSDWTGLELADVVIEAVLETPEAKRDVFAKLDQLVAPTAVLASNTSSLGIAEMARGTQHPQRVVGLHFFNPVPKMPLVEVVRTPQSDDVSLATAVALASRLGKAPVLVTDSPGFLVNRILVPYLAEALVLASEGLGIDVIDDAMKRWGMPMGPFELFDEIGLDISDHVLKSLGSRTSPPAEVSATFALAVEHRWLGKKSGTGFYIHTPTRRRGRAARLTVNSELTAPLTRSRRISPPSGATALDEFRQSIQWRLILPMVNESARVLEENVTDSTDAIDIASVLGLGLAPFRGGIVQFANTVGSEEIVRRLDDLARQCGPRFTPAELLRESARNHRPLNPPGASPASQTIVPNPNTPKER